MAIITSVAYPIVEWIPVGGKDVSVNHRRAEDVTHAGVAGVNPETDGKFWRSLGGDNELHADYPQRVTWPHEGAGSSKSRPINERVFDASLSLKLNSGRDVANHGYAAIDYVNGKGNKHRPAQDEKETWYFHGFWRKGGSAQTNIDSVKANLKVLSETGGSTVSTTYTTTVTNLTATWAEFLVLADVEAYLSNSDWRVSCQIGMKDSVAGFEDSLIVSGMSAGRALNFSKYVNFSNVLSRRATSVTSMGGVTQTDFWNDIGALSISSNDEDYDFYRNGRAFWLDAVQGARWGFARDRTDRSKDWFPSLVLEQDANFLIRPAGAERYQFSFSGREQRIGGIVQPMGRAL